MNNTTFYAPGGVPAIRTAGQILSKKYRIAGAAAPDVTHLLLPVPSFETDGRIRGGGLLENILADLSEQVTVIGGNLNHPALAGYETIDLLRDSEYVAINAALTADCAIRIAGAHLPVTFEECPVLIVGWGRIGKCLAVKLAALGAKVSVAARKEEDRSMLRAMGYGAENTTRLEGNYRIVFNTAPASVLTETALPRDVLKIELASTDGISGSDVIIARGLPGKLVPESSGKLIAHTIIRILEERQV